VQDFSRIEQAVLEAGRAARQKQKEAGIAYKNDGSVVTEVDLQTEKLLAKVIAEEFPNANIVSEEFPSKFQSGRPFTFTIDPIDGTDSYSQGIPGWCVAVGILDSSLQPIGGIVSAPRWGTDPDGGIFISAIPDKEVEAMGIRPLSVPDGIGGGSQLLVGSKVHRRYDFSAYPGKVRSFGSSILHVISPLLHSSIEGALIPPCYIWDIAAAHGIISRYGIRLEYINGSPIRYETMVHRQLAEHYMLSGSEKSIRNIKSHIGALP
jgi:myo-inositol-1(or 4)-monophosphatase